MKKILLLTLALVSCIGANQTTNTSEFCDQEFNYCIIQKIDFKNSKWKPSMGMNGRATAHTVSNKYSDSDPKSVYMEIYNEERCLITPGHMEEVQSTTVFTWGKVVYKPSNDPAGNENDVFCLPLPPATAAYAFCAEKDGKAVAICIQQMTDNPALAKEIFESFRWLPSSHSEPVE